MADLTNDVVFVTGATSGIGASVARKFVSEGARVVATGRREDRLNSLHRELGARLCPIPLDVRDNNAVTQCLKNLPIEFSPITVLVNNAGLSLTNGSGVFYGEDLNDMMTMIDTNIKGVVQVTRAILPGMVERNHGHVFNIGSVGGVYAIPGNSIYGATKSFVHMFSMDLRAELLGHHIRVTVIEPGAVESEFLEIRGKGDKTLQERFKKGTRIISADELSDILFYAFSAPPHVNTNIIEVMPTDQSWNRAAIYRKAQP